jgi:hypothetical protein
MWNMKAILHKIFLIFSVFGLLMVQALAESNFGTSGRILKFRSQIVRHPTTLITVTETITVNYAHKKIKGGITREFPTRYLDRFGNTIDMGHFRVQEVLRDGKPEPYHFEPAAFASWIVGLIWLVILLGYYMAIWRRLGRDTEEGTIIPLYKPPKGLSPAATRYLMLKRFDNKAFAAALVDMAAKGYLAIEDNDGDYTLRKRNSDTTMLFSGERKLAGRLFSGTRDAVEINEKNHSTIKSARGALEYALNAELTKVYLLTSRSYLIQGLILTALALGTTIAASPNPYPALVGLGLVAIGGGACYILTLPSLRYLRYLLGGLILVALEFFSDIIPPYAALVGLGLVAIGGGACYILTVALFRKWRRAGREFLGLGFTFVFLGLGFTFVFLVYFFSYLVYIAAFYAAFYPDAPSYIYFLLGTNRVMSIGVTFIFLGIFILTNGIFFHLLKARTLKGHQVMDQIEGFKLYLSVAEKERMKILHPSEKTPELFEKYLPYCLALDVENEWSEQFANVLARAQDV